MNMIYIVFWYYADKSARREYAVDNRAFSTWDRANEVAEYMNNDAKQDKYDTRRYTVKRFMVVE